MKSPTHLDKCIVCPKCGTKTMRKSIGKGPEYFVDRCHSYFTIEELVNKWGHDYGDFYGGTNTDTQLTTPERNYTTLLLVDRYEKSKLVEMDYAEQEKKIFSLPEHSIRKLNLFSWDYNTVSDSFEGEWANEFERIDAYEEVTAMQLGIPSWSMEDYSVDTGATHP